MQPSDLIQHNVRLCCGYFEAEAFAVQMIRWLADNGDEWDTPLPPLEEIGNAKSLHRCDGINLRGQIVADHADGTTRVAGDFLRMVHPLSDYGPGIGARDGEPRLVAS